MKTLKLITLFLFVICNFYAQDLSKLTPQQLELYKKYMSGNTTNKASTANNDTISERTMVSELKQNELKQNELNQSDLKQKPTKPKNKVFGSEIFNNHNLTFEPKLNIPTPAYYVLGTYDELVVDISGHYDVNYTVKVNTDGSVRIPNIGPVKVKGLTMEEATKIIRNQVAKIYQGVSTGETHVNVSLGNIRSIRITVIGEAARPGTYTIPSLATAFNALYACGGPGEFGSMRDIKVIRHGKTIANIDLYSFLLDGFLKDNVSLQDEDVIKIEPTKIRVIVDGAIKHGGIFETLQGETLQQLFRFSGGLMDNAYKSIITVFRFTETQRTVVDVVESEIPNFQLKSGDSINVSTLFDKFDNRVDINGPVYRPGAYSLEPGLTVRKLIAKADGVKEDAYLNMAFINRKRENKVSEIIGFNLAEVLNGKSPDIFLQKDDSVTIRNLYDYREEQKISIWGAVLSPGTYSVREDITLKGLIFKAKGFTEVALVDSIELIRPIKNSDTLKTSNRKSMILRFEMDKDLNFKPGSGDILLENGDAVIVRSISGYEGIRMVRVEGEVFHPGSYNISNKSEKISDVVKKSGGFTRYAYPTGAFLIRTESTNTIEQKLNKIMQENSKNQLENQPNKTLDATMLKASGATTVQGYTAMDSIQKKLSGSNVVEKLFTAEGVVGINLKEIMNSPGCKYDLKLEEGDIIYVPRELQTVRVLGQVLFPTIVRYDNTMNLRDYINNSGGFSINANRSKVFVLYPNGTAKSTKSFFGIKTYPKIEPGARIVVPENAISIKNKMTTGETVAVLTSISSVVALVYSILKASGTGL